jgi:voltage-gated potassium channel
VITCHTRPIRRLYDRRRSGIGLATHEWSGRVGHVTDIASDASRSAAETEAEAVRGAHGLRYELFILALTIYSLVIMVLLVLPLQSATVELLQTYDNLICFVFLADFGMRLRASHPRRRYLIHERGWLDLLGSMPSLGILRFTVLFRLFRLSRLARVGRLLRQRQDGVLKDVLRNRGQYASFVTVLSALAVVSISSVLVLEFESHSTDANITTGGDSLWWAIVTMTTVGYGDQYPVTPLGRATGTFVMLTGLGIIGALASILASFLVTSSPTEVAADEPAETPATQAPPVHTAAPADGELALLRARIEEMHATLSRLVDHQTGPTAASAGSGGTETGPPRETS